MTDKPTPTDAELKAMWQLHAADIGGIFHYARAVLAKWGQPAQAAEPFCWQWENTFNGGTGAVKKNPETLGINMSHPDYKWTALYTTPQPTQAQAGAVPLTPERVKEIVRGAGYDQCGIPETERAAFINGLRHGEQAHGIKVGQHGEAKP